MLHAHLKHSSDEYWVLRENLQTLIVNNVQRASGLHNIMLTQYVLHSISYFIKYMVYVKWR